MDEPENLAAAVGTVTKAAVSEIYNERSAFAEILSWSEGLPLWQRDALRRLIDGGGGALTEEDIEALTELCLDPTLSAEPLAKEHLNSATTAGHPISLLEVSNLTGVNALATGQTLAFAPSGLSVVYGDNGSGKSGYVRVLKHACRTRDDNRPILRDIQDINGTPQTATVTFSRSDVADTFAWSPSSTHDDLPAVSIFDSRSANIHVEETNAVAYNPYPMQVLASLAETCDAVKARVSECIDALRAQTPQSLRNPTLPEGTSAGDLVRSITQKTNLKTVGKLVTLSDVEKNRLATLELDLSQDPKQAASKVRALLTRFDAIDAAIRAAMIEAADASFAKRDALKLERDTAKEAADLASDALFAASPLPEVGGDVWRALWEAARTYSQKIAYPGRQFPVAKADEDLCVLCQQPLDEEAVQRQATFETFIKGTTKADEARTGKAYRAILDRKIATVTMVQIAAARLLVRDELGDAALAEKLVRCGVSAAARIRALKREGLAGAAMSEYPQAEVDEKRNELRQRLSQLTADEKSPERLAALADRAELKSRQSLGLLEADIQAEVDRLKQIADLEKAAKTAAKRPITDKNKDISDRLVTNALRGRFAREIDKLKLARMPIELRKVKDRTAVSYFRVCLVEQPDSDVGEIFSEGEHRCVALAAFMAELVTSQQYSGIVFDDPMSSLDHIHRRAVAARLVEEAAHRQVIVFTHDLTFLFELRREAEAKQQAIHCQTVRRKTDRPGYVEGELPTKAKSALQLANALRTELKAMKGQFDHWSDMDRTIRCKGVIEQLREAWDQGIADFILPVLGRFDNAIKGTSLYKLVVLTDADVAVVTGARSRLSEDLHVSSETLNPEQVTHAELVAEVGKLEVWLQDMADRQKAAKGPAKAPPVAAGA